MSICEKQQGCESQIKCICRWSRSTFTIDNRERNASDCKGYRGHHPKFLFILVGQILINSQTIQMLCTATVSRLIWWRGCEERNQSNCSKLAQRNVAIILNECTSIAVFSMRFEVPHGALENETSKTLLYACIYNMYQKQQSCER